MHCQNISIVTITEEVTITREKGGHKIVTVKLHDIHEFM